MSPDAPGAARQRAAVPPLFVELVSTKTADGIELDGASYRPGDGNTRQRRGFLLVHGMRWNFYRGPSRWLGPLLAMQGYDCLALNLRDHDSSEPQGLENAFHDLRAGVDLLMQRCNEVIPFAHGYGCTKVMSYAAQSGDARVRRHVLTTLGAVARNHPPIWQAALGFARIMPGRSLVVQGAADALIEARIRADELARAAPASRVDVVLLEGANHYFDDRHDALVDCVTAWEERTRSAAANAASNPSAA
jgi:alpha-beta hydrolase superfamily lysophospholipase